MAAQKTFDEMVYSKNQTIFNLNAPTTKDGLAGIDKQRKVNKPSVKLRIYNDGIGGKTVKTVKMKRNGQDRWTASVKGDLKGKYYTFDISRGETPGVFAKAVGVNGQRGAVVDLSDTNPVGWARDKRVPTPSTRDIIIYEMHHRDFSIDASSGLQHKGKFLALTEPKAIEHLKSLGITAVHLLPSFDYASVDETKLEQNKYNWGYDPLNYNVPEGSYSTNPYNPTARIREFKQMVQALHKAGIRVFLDVVYNHTFDMDGSGFQRTYPDKYYRFTPDGKPSNGSGCKNETASEQPLMRQFMVESMRYWVNEYHIDGFRVDLMGIHDIETMNTIRKELDKIDPTIFMYGEGWSAGQCAYPIEKLAIKANMQQMPRIAAFSDEIRDALRGPFSDESKGAFLAGIPGEEESLKYGIAGGIAHPDVDQTKVNYSKAPFAGDPSQLISYVSCHDDMCLVDRLRAEIPGIDERELIRLDLLAQTAVFTSQGVPFMLSGEEMLRNKKGVHNSFESPDSINHLDWDNLQRYPQVFDYYSNLISLRKHHPAFGGQSAETVREHLRFFPTQPCFVGYQLTDMPNEPWKNIIVLLNANRDAKEVSMPDGQWTVVCCDGVINEAGLETINGGKVVVDAQSALILHD
ncbi:MAG: type I pullulanase [Prevotella sp.]